MKPEREIISLARLFKMERFPRWDVLSIHDSLTPVYHVKVVRSCAI